MTLLTHFFAVRLIYAAPTSLTKHAYCERELVKAGKET